MSFFRITTALLASVTEDMFEDEPQLFNDNSVKVERILLEMVRPDPVQPRRVLPEQIHHKFHNNRLTPTQALRELVQVAQVSARQKGRPFTNEAIFRTGCYMRDEDYSVCVRCYRCSGIYSCPS